MLAHGRSSLCYELRGAYWMQIPFPQTYGSAMVIKKEISPLQTLLWDPHLQPVPLWPYPQGC